MFNPGFGGLSINDLNERIKAGKKVEISAKCQSKDEKTCWDAECKIKDFRGAISLSNDLVLTMKGEGKFQASSYAFDIIEDEGCATVLSNSLVFLDDMLSVDPTAGGKVKIGTADSRA